MIIKEKMQIYYITIDNGQADENDIVQHGHQGDDSRYTNIYSYQGDDGDIV